jgi:hypothetical protein
MKIEVPIIENLTKTDKKHKGMAPRKKKMIEALSKHLGIITSACQEVGLTRETHYQWLKNDKDYADAVSALETKKDDVIEKAFLSLVIDKNPQAVIHAVKTKLKHRGYGEDPLINNQSSYTFKIERPEVKNGNNLATK